MWKRLIASFQYRLDELFAGGTFGKALILGVFTVLVVGIGMLAGLCGLFGEANAGVAGIPRSIDAGPRDALWWSFHHVLDPSFFAENYGATPLVLVISLIVAIGGMVVFGALVGLITTTLEERLDLLRRGDGTVHERGHFLLLGWNAKGPDLIALIQARHPRARIVILAAGELAAVRDDLRQIRRNRIVIRHGSPADPADLERVAIGSAKGIILLPAEAPENARASADAEVIRALLVLADRTWNEPRPRFVAEIEDARHATAARLAGRDIPVVATGEIVALLLFQCSRQRGISHAYHELIAPHGANIRIRPATALVGDTFADIAYAYPRSVVLGTSRREEQDGRIAHRHRLNPPRSEHLASGDWLMLLAHGEEAPIPVKHSYRSAISLHHTLVPGETAAAEALADSLPLEPAADHADAITGRRLPPPARWRVLILGWNDHLPLLLAEYDRCQGSPAEIRIVSGHTSEEAVELLADRGLQPTRIVPDFRRADVLVPGTLAALAPAGYDAIVVLADSSREGTDPDARTVMTLVLLRDLLAHLTTATPRPRLSAEVLTANAGTAAEHLGIDDLVVGPHLVSRQIMQVAEQTMVAAILDDLLSSGGMDIYLKPVERYVRLHTEVTFRDLIYSAQHLDETAMGVWLASPRRDRPAGLHLAPGQGQRWELEPGDQVVVIAEELYDVETAASTPKVASP